MTKKITKKNSTKLKRPGLLTQFLRHTKASLTHNLPVLFLVFFSLIICFLNFDSKAFLTGWDNLHPEFNINLDLQRTFFSVWQEYRSTGLLAGMAHAADLPRQILIYLLLLFKTPTNLIRYLTTFLPLVLGPVGVYFLIQQILFESKQTSKTIKTGAFLAGLYYIFNLSTLQTFFIPFETFTWFYGALPFLLFYILRYLKQPTIASFILVFFVSFLSGTAFYVETIFVVLFLCLLPFIIEFLLSSKNKIISFSHSVLASLALMIPHLYWLAPIVFYVQTNAFFTTQNRINLISSPETYYRNLEFGNIQNIFLLKSYLFKFLDLLPNGKYDYLLSVWRNHLSNNLITICGYTIFTLIAMGIYFSLKEKLAWCKSFLSVLLISFFFLLGGGLLINNTIPLIGELFRSPFTKFSIPLSLAYSYFFAVGVIFLLDIFSYLDSKLTHNFTVFTCVFLLIIYMSPAFSGNFISKSMRVTIPNEYFELFRHLNTQPKDQRIANFPQHTFWGWNYYSWGYRGSGFLWYGIKQPILDRAFDVWEKTSESYYEELSTSLYSQNTTEFNRVIDKYNVTYLLIDKSVIAPETKANLGLNYLETIINNDSKYQLEKTFGDNLFLYKNTSQKSQNFLSLSAPSTENSAPNTLLDFPLRPSQNWYNKAGYLNTNVTISALSTENSAPNTLLIPSLSDSENLLPYKIEYRKISNSLFVRLTPITPVFFLNQKQIDLSTKPQLIQIPIGNANKKFILNVNSQYFPFELPSEIEDFQNYYPITEIYLPTQKNFDFGLYRGIPSDQSPLVNSLINNKPTLCYYKPESSSPERQIEKIISPRSVTLLGTDLVACLSTSLPTAKNDQLLSVTFTYYSPTLTTANVNITDENFGATNTSQPLDPSNTPKQTQIFTKPSNQNKQLNLILEASETKSIQEITYKDVYLSTHDPLFEATISLNKIPKQIITLTEKENKLQISLPNTNTQFDTNQISTSNALFPEDKNCDQFNKGQTVKQVNLDHILYQSKNATECDYLNLRHFEHSLNYLIGIDAQNSKGLNLTSCLENHSTRRCDVYERLTNTNSTQYLLQSISNPQESNGYTLHLFNQSLGNKISENRLNSITIRPFPLTFLKNIAVSSTNRTSVIPGTDLNSTHPTEFLYTVAVIPAKAGIHSENSLLNLYQTNSPYWKAFTLPENYKNLNPWRLALNILLNYKSLPQLEKINNNQWFNSWSLSPNCNLRSEICNLAVIYLPQYLEFLGFAILILTSITLLILALIKQTVHKKTSR